MKRHSSYYASLAKLAGIYGVIAIIFLIANQCFAQESNSIGAGVTMNKMEGLDVGVGYYVSGNAQGKLTDYVGYWATLQFSNYHTKVGDLGVNFYSVDPAFAFSIWPTKEKFSLLAGVSVNHIFRARIDGDSYEAEGTDIFFSTGATFDLTEKFSIIGRYNIPVADKYFKYTGQLGISFKLN